MNQTIENVAGEWVSVSVAARMLRRTSNQIMNLCKQGLVERKLRRVSHAHCRPVWMYSVPDLLKLREQYRKDGSWNDLDEIIWRSQDGVWISVSDACNFLRCTATTVHALMESGDLRIKKRVLFEVPCRRVMTGVHIRDVMAIRRQQAAVQRGSAASEEINLVAVETDSKIDLAAQLRTIIEEARSASITKRRLIGILETLVDQA